MSFYLFIAISFYLFISILCAKILCVNWVLKRHFKRLKTQQNVVVTHCYGKDQNNELNLTIFYLLIDNFFAT